MRASHGNIIILNGTSSSGKSTLAKALQVSLDGYYFHTGIDHFLVRMPESAFTMSDGINPDKADGFLWVTKDERVIEIRLGPIARQLLESLYLSVKATASTGLNVIVDDVIFDTQVLQKMVQILADMPAWLVGVRCPKEEAIRREEERGDRRLGLVEAHYDLVHAHGHYDLEIDTSANTVEECVESIRRMLVDNPSPAALQLLKHSS